MQPSTNTEPGRSYFHDQQAIRARRDDIAAPAQIDDLLNKADYLTDNKLELIRKAYDYAVIAHAKQYRRTGHPYITHPLAVASILADMRMDAECIVAALLHDVLEDTSCDKDALLQPFGNEVAEIVSGVSKISNMNTSDTVLAQAQNFQRLLVASANDIRVIIVKLADRLHNMRTLGVMELGKRKRIAAETMDIYAPIADRLGIHSFKNDLEDLAFEALYPVRSDHIEDAIRRFRKHNQSLMANVHCRLEDKLREEQIPARVAVHERHLFSIYETMRDEKRRFKDIMNVFAFDILVDDVASCYRALGAVHMLFRPRVEEFKDYIAVPKVNGYQSLHTSILTPDNIPIKLFIRTEKMHAMAQLGIMGEQFLDVNKENQNGSSNRSAAWIREVLELQKMAGDSKEFLASLKLDLFTKDVYVFTPKGELIDLPQGACALDFAYAIHSDIGNTATSCTIDKEPAALTTTLEPGQTVEITTEPSAHPHPNWIGFVVTAKARAAIRQALNKLDHDTAVTIGQKLLSRKLAQNKVNLDTLSEEQYLSACDALNIENMEELFAQLGTGRIPANSVLQQLLEKNGFEYSTINIDHDGPLAIQGGEGHAISYGKCCGPVPGDNVVAYMSTGKGLVVHLRDCKTGSMVRSDQAEMIPVRWSAETKGEFETVLRLVITHTQSPLADIASTISEVDAGIEQLHVSERSGRTSTVLARIAVRNLAHLKDVFNRLKNKPYVQNVTRPEGEENSWQHTRSTAQMPRRQSDLIRKQSE